MHTQGEGWYPLTGDRREDKRKEVNHLFMVAGESQIQGAIGLDWITVD